MFTLYDLVRRADMTTLGLDACLLHKTLLCHWQEAYTEEHLGTPTWLEERVQVLTRRIRDLKADQHAAEIARLKSVLAYLQPPDEKRAALQEKLTRLEASIAP